MFFDRLIHRFHGPSEIVGLIEQRAGTRAADRVSDAIDDAKAAGVPWLQILVTLLPFVLNLLSGGTFDLAALIAAILALIPK